MLVEMKMRRCERRAGLRALRTRQHARLLFRYCTTDRTATIVKCWAEARVQRLCGTIIMRVALAGGLAPATMFVPVAYADCIDDVATYFTLDPNLLRAIAQHESGMRPFVINRNANGSVDIGLMQINSGWLPTLERAGIAPQSLWNACVNAYVGAWILSSNIARFGATWKAVGAYNAASPAKQLRYANQIYAQWQSARQHSQVTQRP
jgi:soluble lytic murein transglycosylase-like protein